MGDAAFVPPGDGRPRFDEILAAAARLEKAGWQCVDIAAQGEFPIRAWFNAPEVDHVLIGGIHGREPAGAAALARYIPRLAELGRTHRLLVMPLLNPWGYAHHERYGPSGQSVSDSDHLLGRSASPACPEADAITGFVMHGIRILPGAAVLDLHEDPVYEAPGYAFDGAGSYLYFVGGGASDKPASCRVRAVLESSPLLPLVREGVTRFGERLTNGAIVDSPDGSIDELLARCLACSPVITVENLLHAPDSPPLETRVVVYLAVLEAFFGSSAGTEAGGPV